MRISFEPGQDFRHEILRNLDQSGLFVFLASSDSIRSTWCKYELDQAELKRMDGGISGQLALIIDPNVSFGQLPKWMRSAKALVQPRPSQAVRDIQQALFAVVSRQAGKPFLGRLTEQAEFAEALATSKPSVFIITGLDGIGRRTYLERACLDGLGLHLGPFFLIDETHAMEDVYLSLIEETADIGGRRDLLEHVSIFRELDPKDQINEMSAQLHALCKDRNLPCFVDRGGLLEDLGQYKQSFSDLITGFLAANDDHYLAFIHRRLPSAKQ